MSPPISIPLWAGWRKSLIPYADEFKINSELDRLLAQSLKSKNIQNDSPVFKLVAFGDIMLARAFGKRISAEIKGMEKAIFSFAETSDILKKPTSPHEI